MLYEHRVWVKVITRLSSYPDKHVAEMFKLLNWTSSAKFDSLSEMQLCICSLQKVSLNRCICWLLNHISCFNEICRTHCVKTRYKMRKFGQISFCRWWYTEVFVGRRIVFWWTQNFLRDWTVFIGAPCRSMYSYNHQHYSLPQSMRCSHVTWTGCMPGRSFHWRLRRLTSVTVSKRNVSKAQPPQGTAQ